MTILEAIKARHSVRAFTDQKIEADVKDKLGAYIADCNAHSGLHLQLVTDEPDAFGKSRLAHYGKFENANNYIAVIGPKLSATPCGYYGEKVVLYAQQLGLNTCWVGLTFKKGKVKQLVGELEEIYALIAIGYGKTQGVQHKSKTPQQISEQYDVAPQWFKDGVDAALLAPTALNQQKFRFTLLEGSKVHASRGMGFYTKLDLGIAMLHFKLGAGEDNFTWG